MLSQVFPLRPGLDDRDLKYEEKKLSVFSSARLDQAESFKFVFK